jgi:hypothetical protein
MDDLQHVDRARICFSGDTRGGTMFDDALEGGIKKAGLVVAMVFCEVCWRASSDLSHLQPR